MPAMDRLSAALRAALLALGWLVSAALIAAGGAGLATTVGGDPSTPARAELTWASDQAIRPGLVAAVDDLDALAGHLDELGSTVRTALAALVATDRGLLDSTVAAGASDSQTIASEAARLRLAILDLPGVGSDPTAPLAPDAAIHLGAAERAMVTDLLAAIEVTRGLPEAWGRFTAGSIAAERLTTLLVDHDASTAAAAASGSAGRYDEALAMLDRSDAILAEARSLRDRLANTTDVTVLDEWLDRNGEYDAALRRLYAGLVASGGRVTDEVREAFAAEQAARDRLPPDTRGLTVILADVARGGLNDVAIGVEQARGQLEAAVEALRAVDLQASAEG